MFKFKRMTTLRTFLVAPRVSCLHMFAIPVDVWRVIDGDCIGSSLATGDFGGLVSVSVTLACLVTCLVDEQAQGPTQEGHEDRSRSWQPIPPPPSPLPQIQPQAPPQRFLRRVRWIRHNDSGVSLHYLPSSRQ